MLFITAIGSRTSKEREFFSEFLLFLVFKMMMASTIQKSTTEQSS